MEPFKKVLNNFCLRCEFHEVASLPPVPFLPWAKEIMNSQRVQLRVHSVCLADKAKDFRAESSEKSWSARLDTPLCPRLQNDHFHALK